MKKPLSLFAFILPLLTFAQKPFTVTGTGNGFKNGDKFYLSYSKGNINMLDSLMVSNGSFTFKGDISGISQATLYKNENPMLIETSHDALQLYIEPGNIVIASRDSMEAAKISGTPNNVDYIVLRDALAPIRNKYRKALTDFDKLTPQEQISIENKAYIRKVIKDCDTELLPVQLNFIKTHPNSHISLITLKQLVNQKDFLPQVLQAYNSITPEQKETALGKTIGQNINASLKTVSGIMAPGFTLPDVAGKPVSLADYKGKYVLVDFWASWCLPCRQENPFIKSAYEKYKNKGFTVLGISLDDVKTKAAWLKAIKDDGLPWTQASDLKGFNSKAALLYGVTSIPSNVLIDPEGKIIATNIKDQTLHNKLAEIFQKASTN